MEESRTPSHPPPQEEIEQLTENSIGIPSRYHLTPPPGQGAYERFHSEIVDVSSAYHARGLDVVNCLGCFTLSYKLNKRLAQPESHQPDFEYLPQTPIHFQPAVAVGNCAQHNAPRGDPVGHRIDQVKGIIQMLKNL